jgi:hypothetical protein
MKVSKMSKDKRERNTQPMQMPAPDPALKRLEKLVGTWSIKGRTLDSKKDNISGQVTIEWILGGLFLQQRGELDFIGSKIQSLEIIGYDPSTKTFPSYVFSNLGERSVPYQWDVQGNVVTHWTKGSKYTGTLSKDGNILSGGWRPEKGKGGPEDTYDATMIRVK